MSKLMMNTREKILDRALEMFNERGIEYVGLRELAAVLDMRVSNITYYFPTKDDLVYEISMELKKANSGIMVWNEHMTMAGFLDMLRQVFNNHYRFRCLLLSFVHVISQNKQVAASYKKTQNVRGDTIASSIATLTGSGFLKLENDEVAVFLVSNLALISRFWISEAAISMRNLSHDAQINYMEIGRASCRERV